jgi:hypothetical protein
MFNIYALRDVVADDTKTVFHMKTDGLAVRSILPVYAPKFPLQDLVLYCIGTYDDETMEIKSTPSRVVSWDSYKFPQENVNEEIKTIE